MFITEMTAVGGVMIMAIGLNIAGLAKIKAANLLRYRHCWYYGGYLLHFLVNNDEQPVIMLLKAFQPLHKKYEVLCFVKQAFP